MVEFIDKTEQKTGTKINRKNLMAVQGFLEQETIFSADGSIIITNADGQTHTIKFNSDGSVTETFTGEKTITKTTKFTGNKIVEEIQ